MQPVFCTHDAQRLAQRRALSPHAALLQRSMCARLAQREADVLRRDARARAAAIVAHRAVQVQQQQIPRRIHLHKHVAHCAHDARARVRA
jgi:hypothetical protein